MGMRGLGACSPSLRYGGAVSTIARLALCLAFAFAGLGCNPCDSGTRFEPNILLDAGPVCSREDAGPPVRCVGNSSISCPAGCACYSLKTLNSCGVELYHGTAACFCGVNPSTQKCDVPNCGSISCPGGCDVDAGTCALGV